MELPLPPLPKHSFKPLSSQNFPVGARLVHFIQKKLNITVPPEFRDNCDVLDATREQLRNTIELPLDRVEQVVDYFHLLTTLTQGFDLSESAAGLQFIWNKVSLYNIDFEICCMAYNLAVGLCSACERIDLAKGTLPTLVKTIKSAKGLLDKAREHFQEDFSSALQSNQIDDIEFYLKAIFYQAQVSVILTSGKTKFIPAAARLASVWFGKLRPPATEHAKYYTIIANCYQSERDYNEAKYGHSVCYTRQVFNDIPKDKALKKVDEPFKSLYPQLLAAYKPVGDKFEHENSKIFFEPVPDYEEIAPLKATNIDSNVDWTKFVTPCSPFESQVSDTCDSKINDRLTNFKTEAGHALKDIEDSLALIQPQSATETKAKHERMVQTRSDANNTCQQVSTIMGLKSNAISQRCPQLFQQFNQMRAALTKAAETDVYYETQMAKAESMNDSLVQKGTQLEEKRDKIKQILRLADIAAEEARKGCNGMSATIEAMGAMQKKFDDLANQLNPIFTETLKLVREVKAEAEKAVPEFNKEMASAANGFDQAINCYTKLTTNFNAILTTANQC